MNYIEQMMKMSGVEQEEEKYCYWECKNPELRNIACNNTQCTHYRHVIHPYPPFTAEKQINIIKLLGKSTDLHYFGWGMSSLCESSDTGTIEVENDDFTQALAQLTTELMNAGELDKEKVKEVLEDAR